MASLREDVLQALLVRKESGLSELAAHLGREPPVVLHHLQALVQEGLIARDETSTRPVYRPQHFFGATWVNPITGTVDRWSAADRVSWRFPLVSRLRDARGRQTVLRFLTLAEERGLFANPHVLTADARKGRRATRSTRTTEPIERAQGLRIAVYGSVARGDVGPSSDTDVLVLPGKARDVAALFEDLAAEVNLDTPRRLDLVVATSESKLSARFVDAVRKDARIVYSNFEDGFYEPIFPKETA